MVRVFLIRWMFFACAIVSIAVVVAPVRAQRTGSSYGGGSFHSGSSSSGSRSGGRSSRRSYDYDDDYDEYYDDRYSSSSNYTLSWTELLILVLGIVGFLGVWIALGFYFSRKRSGGWKKADISAIQLGIDWRARRELQATLDRLGKAGVTSTPKGLAYLLRETVLALRRAEVSWLYCAVDNYRPMSAASAEGIFRQLGVDARSRFKEELHRNVDGSEISRAASPVQARPEEGEGVVVVTLIVAANRELLDVEQPQDANEIKTLLDEMVAVANPEMLVAMEVIWSPSAENDRMSTVELEALYGHLEKIDERSIAGRTFCSYCSAPFAAELLECPHCGAPASAAQAGA